MNDLHSPDLNSEELARQIDEAFSRDGEGAFSPGNDPRVDAALRLANAKHPAMPPEMLARVQSKVIAAHRQQVRRQRTWRPQNSVFLRMAATFAIILIFIGSTALPAFANSVPGDFWYPFKRNLETLELSAASSPTDRANLYLTQAERRLDEATVLLQRKLFDTDLLVDARNSLASFNQLAAQIGDALPNREGQVALITESMSILLQEAEQLQVVSGDQVVALLPSLLPLPTDTPTQAASATDVPPTEVALVVVATATDAPPTEAATDAPPVMEVTESAVTEEPTAAVQASETPVPSDTPTETLTPSDTPSLTPTAVTPLALATMYALENANVREKAGQSQPIITILHHGESTAVIGEDDTGKWWHVRLTDGRLGWIAKFLLSANPPPAANNPADGNNANDPAGNCDHPGNYCNAPGQTGTLPAQSNGNGNPGGKPDNPGNGNSPAAPGNGHKP